MVEGGLIDVAHHNNNAKRALEETLEFENAILVSLYIYIALAFYHHLCNKLQEKG